MALPLAVSLASLERPVQRALVVRGRILSPPAVESDSYLGGFAQGARFTYNDAKQFVWWTPDAMPGAVGFGSGAYGSGLYSEPAPLAGYGSDLFGRGPYGGE